MHGSIRLLANPRAAVAALVAVAVLAPGVAHAHLTTDEGGVADTRSIQLAATSDLTADADVFFTAGNTGYGACVGYTSKPEARYAASSPTLQEMRSPIVVQCNGYNVVALDAYIQQARWDGWRNLVRRDIDGTGQNFMRNSDIVTACRAGTWSYRTYVGGTWNGSSAHGVTKSTRWTCVDPSNLLYIDPA